MNRPPGGILRQAAGSTPASTRAARAKSGCQPRARDAGAMARSTTEPRAGLGGEVVHEQELSAGPDHAAHLIQEGAGARHDGGHEHRDRDVEMRVREAHGFRVHDMQPRDPRQAEPADARAGMGQHVGRQDRCP